MADLPERERVVLRLTYLEGRTVQEAAKLLGTAPRTVRAQRQRAVARLCAIVTRRMREEER